LPPAASSELPGVKRPCPAAPPRRGGVGGGGGGRGGARPARGGGGGGARREVQLGWGCDALAQAGRGHSQSNEQQLECDRPAVWRAAAASALHAGRSGGCCVQGCDQRQPATASWGRPPHNRGCKLLAPSCHQQQAPEINTNAGGRTTCCAAPGPRSCEHPVTPGWVQLAHCHNYCQFSTVFLCAVTRLDAAQC